MTYDYLPTNTVTFAMLPNPPKKCAPANFPLLSLPSITLFRMSKKLKLTQKRGNTQIYIFFFSIAMHHQCRNIPSLPSSSQIMATLCAVFLHYTEKVEGTPIPLFLTNLTDCFRQPQSQSGPFQIDIGDPKVQCRLRLYGIGSLGGWGCFQWW